MRLLFATSGLALAAAALLASGCGNETVVRGADDPGAPTVVATSGIAADITANVGGEDVRVLQLVPDGSNPHSYAPSAKQQQELEEADLVVLVSPALEEALPLDAVENSFALADHVAAERQFQAGEIAGHEEEGERKAFSAADLAEEAEHEEGHDAGSADPHVWMDPTQIEAALPALAEALAGIDPEHAAGFEQRAASYGDEMEQLDGELARITATIPPADRKLVTSHELMGYFADRYGFEFIGAPFGVSPEAEASASTVSGLIDDVEAAQVPAVFAQTGDDAGLLERIADEADVEVVDDLLVESLDPEAGVESYADMMRFTARRIAGALTTEEESP